MRKRLAHRSPTSRQLWTGLVLTAVGAALVLGLMSTGAQATGGGRIAAACSNETVVLPGGKLTVRFVLHGHVLCDEAQRTMRAYARALVAGRCPTEICSQVTFAGGWTCSAPIPALQRPNGPIAGCERRNARFDVYKATRPDNHAIWHKIAQRARFPVYRPTQTLGLKLAGLVLDRDGCLLAGWGKPPFSSNGPHFGVYEPAGTVMCGQAGVATQVATAVVNGVKAQVLVQCATWPKCTIKDGETKGEFLLFVPERGAKHYSIQLQSMHVSLSDFLKVANSFTRVPK
jgi:hypothetical protein